MSEQSAASPSAGSESSAGEGQQVDSTSNAPESNNSSSSPGAGSVGNVKGAEASQVKEALENAEQVGSMFEVVIDGETIKLTREQLTAGYQKAAASAKRFQQAAEKEKAAAAKETEANELRKSLLANPLKAMREAGVNEESARKYFEEMTWAWLQEDQLSPEQKTERAKQKEFETEKQKVAREKAEIEAWKAEREAEKSAKEVERHQNEYATQLAQTLEKHALPKSPTVVNKLIEIMKDGLSYDDTFSFEDAAEVYKEDHQSSIESYLKSLTPEQLMAKMGPDFVKQWRKQDVQANVKNPASAPRQPSVSEPKARDDGKISAKELFARR